MAISVYYTVRICIYVPDWILLSKAIKIFLFYSGAENFQPIRCLKSYRSVKWGLSSRYPSSFAGARVLDPAI